MQGFGFHPNVGLPYLATDFSEYASASDLASGDWTKRAAANPTFMTAIIGSPITSLSGQSVTITHSGGAQTYGTTWNRIPSTTATAEILALITWGSAGPNGGSGIIARSDATTANAYNCVQHGTNTNVHSVFETAKFTGGAYSSLNQGTTIIVAGLRYWVRFQVNSTTVRSRIWLYNAVEPTTWESSSIDASYATGYIGFLVVDSSPSYSCEWFSVGINGATAPSPSG